MTEPATTKASHLDVPNRTDNLTRQLYSTDASIYELKPEGVVFPHEPGDLKRVVEHATSHDQTITVRGGGTSLSGQAIGEGLVVDCSRHLDGLEDLDPEAETVTVQPGVILDHLNDRLADHGLQFGPDVAPSSRATIGGMVGNNSAGAHSIRYGHTADHLRTIQCVLSNGERVTFEPVSREEASRRAKQDTLEGRLYAEVPELVNNHREVIRDHYPDLPRNVAGYGLDRFLDKLDQGTVDFTQLVAGSEGTLALTEQATLDVVPRPESTVLGVLHCETMEEALQANQRLVAKEPYGIELIDQKIIELARESLEYRRKLSWVKGDPRALLMVQAAGSTTEQAVSRLDKLEELLRHNDFRGEFHRAHSVEDQEEVWAVRKAGLPLLLGLPGNRKPTTFVEDTVVDTDRLADYVRRFQDLVADHGTEAAFYGHASVGCLHIRPLVDLKDEDDITGMRDLARQAVDLVQEFDGTISGEHGDGLARSEWLEQYYGSELVDVFEQIKGLFDPKGRLNPGKIVDPKPMNQNLRFGGDYQASVPDTVQDFSDQGGFQEIVERCNGNAACRKEESGTMCPSYMVTRDEQHSTRGRANALRGLMNGDLEPESLADGTMEEVMDLCISCKACKSECPSNVDMAPLKEEILHQVHQENGAGLRSRFFGFIGRAARLLAPFQPVVSWLQELPGAEFVLKRFLDIAPERDLPALDPSPVRPDDQTGIDPDQISQRDDPVVLYIDTFSGYIESDIGRAARELLEGLGHEVIVPETPCCGRPLMSKGFLDKAKYQHEKTLSVLEPYVEADVPIVGLEPSCVSALTDDLPRYVGDGADDLAAGTSLLSDFLNQDHDSLTQNIELDGDLLVHGHCHQKALWGTDELEDLLGELTSGKVEVVDSGCCGMAGSFGFEAEHYEHSRRMAERKLSPAVRQADEGTRVVAAGTSCRQQINHFTDREALHPVELLVGGLTP